MEVELSSKPLKSEDSTTKNYGKRAQQTAVAGADRAMQTISDIYSVHYYCVHNGQPPVSLLAEPEEEPWILAWTDMRRHATNQILVFFLIPVFFSAALQRLENGHSSEHMHGNAHPLGCRTACSKRCWYRVGPSRPHSAQPGSATYIDTTG